MDWDILILGAGPAGLAAGIYAGRSKLKTLILESEMPGGRVIKASAIENFPGFPEGISGYELTHRMLEQVKRFNAELRYPENVVALDLKGEVKTVATRKGAYKARAIILAVGTHNRKLLVPGEVELLGRGVSYCATCDGFFFRDRSVAVVGSGEEAAEDAVLIAGSAAKVTLVPNAGELEMSAESIEKLKDKKVQILHGAKVEAIEGEEAVNALKLADGGRLSVDGVFVALGSVPMTKMIEKAGVKTDDRGCIIVDRKQRTNVEGVFAAGDCTCGSMQVATAVGEGAAAAIAAASYVKRKR